MLSVVKQVGARITKEGLWAELQRLMPSYYNACVQLYYKPDLVLPIINSGKGDFIVVHELGNVLKLTPDVYDETYMKVAGYNVLKDGSIRDNNS